MWGEYIEQRKKQRQKEEEELRKLKERQAKRKTQRAEQEKLLIEMKKKQEEQKLREIVCDPSLCLSFVTFFQSTRDFASNSPSLLLSSGPFLLKVEDSSLI